MTIGATQIGIVQAPLGYRIGYVLAALDDSPVASAVGIVARQMTRYLEVPMREVHATGNGRPGDSTRSRLARVEEGEASEVTGHPSAILTALIESPASPLAVLGMPSTRRPRQQRITGTTFSVARRVTRPLLVVPRELKAWNGPHRILVPLNGSASTAYAASLAVATLNLGAMTTTPVHVFHSGTVPYFWDQPQHEYDAWIKEFKARYVDEVLEDGFEVRSGPRTPSEHLIDMTEQGEFDLVVAVWSQLAAGSKGEVVVNLLESCPVPVLLVPATFGISKTSHR